MTDREEEVIPKLRWWMSYGGTTAFFVLSLLVIWRGSIKIPRIQHYKLMKYWERTFATLYVLFVLGVQVGTFTMKELWGLAHGPDDAWEILWGAVGLAASALCCIALYSKQCYRIHLHHALLLHMAFCFICVADLIIRDNMTWHVVPMTLCCFYGMWMVAVAPRVFQITGHASTMAENNDEWFVILYGIPRKYQMISRDELENIPHEAIGIFARCVVRISDCCRKFRK